MLKTPKHPERCPSSSSLQALQALTLVSQDLPRALPFPAALHNLRTLRVGNSTCTPSWLQQLGGLRQLQQLEMAVELGVGGMEDPAPPRLPAMPALTSLDLTLREGPAFRCVLGLQHTVSATSLCVVCVTGLPRRCIPVGQVSATSTDGQTPCPLGQEAVDLAKSHQLQLNFILCTSAVA